MQGYKTQAVAEMILELFLISEEWKQDLFWNPAVLFPFAGNVSSVELYQREKFAARRHTIEKWRWIVAFNIDLLLYERNTIWETVNKMYEMLTNTINTEWTKSSDSYKAYRI